MPLPSNRQNSLNTLLANLREIPGIASVEQDDFDSHSINIFLGLKVNSRAGCMTSSTRPWRFAEPLGRVKAAIGRTCQQQRVYFHFLDWPKKQYTTNGPGRRVDDGYTHENIKIEVEL